MVGYEFQPLKDQDIAVHLLDVHKGHDTFQISKALTRIYYIIEGTGVFTINHQGYVVVPGLLVEVPPGVEYSYSGSMKIILVSFPRWFDGNDRMTRMNPDVVNEGRVVGFIRKLRCCFRQTTVKGTSKNSTGAPPANQIKCKS